MVSFQGFNSAFDEVEFVAVLGNLKQVLHLEGLSLLERGHFDDEMISFIIHRCSIVLVSQFWMFCFV